ncbi:MAG TPA: PHP-associated domain-containing protein [Alphaproteobacteria bacterium]|nr:PHP-associated domain-containing protein [Alphaproteobacteria bacterium]
MILDMHVHTRVSLDATATVEEYCEALLKYREIHPVDGFVITEHRVIDRSIDYRKLGERYGIVILQGVEVDGDFGHILLYGVNDECLRYIDLANRRLNDREVIRIMKECGGIAIPAHPFRESLYGRAFEQKKDWAAGVEIIEEFNGANTVEQNAKASAIVARDGLRGIGGSDAHYVNWFLKCATLFERRVETMAELVDELYAGRFTAIQLPQLPGGHEDA